MNDEPKYIEVLQMEAEERIWPEYAGLEKIHFCPDYDGMLVWGSEHNYKGCQCFPMKNSTSRKRLNNA